ncbi:hypothetical protein [Chryseobacterium hagamense]|uniref:Uncharacterized protein n=1 Tax=Chryseobacterium hagamense TaxID=395935 RepID=A0A511YJQ3_9FLAO|nr:hypothetical protein [Chryseobacterium hagamense]GEN75404.1 hypothetical protein CHA01nite_11440 [Chryseobacterium hagamense]
MMKALLLLLIACGNLLTAQLLTVNNLRNSTSGPLRNLDARLKAHFNLERNPDMEDPGNRVYAASDRDVSHFKVLTVFTDARNCLALSLVTHDKEEIEPFHNDLLKEGFMLEKYRDLQGNPGINYIREQIIVTIKNINAGVPAHQVIWRCR